MKYYNYRPSLLCWAVDKDWMGLAWVLLKLGADVHQKVGKMVYLRDCDHDWNGIGREDISLVDVARSDEMKQLLELFGGLPTEDTEHIWFARTKRACEKRQRQYLRRERLAKRRKHRFLKWIK